MTFLVWVGMNPVAQTPAMINIDEQILCKKIGKTLASAPKPQDSIAPPTFSDGSDENIGLFLKQYKALTVAQNWKAEDQVSRLPLSSGGSALAWYTRRTSVPNQSWDDLK